MKNVLCTSLKNIYSYYYGMKCKLVACVETYTTKEGRAWLPAKARHVVARVGKKKISTQSAPAAVYY
jgi:hypothetical protein